MALEDESGQERTEAPTGKRIQDARGKGQVLRSKEMATAFVLIGAACTLIVTQSMLGEAMVNIMRMCFILERDIVFDTAYMMKMFGNTLQELILPIGIFFIVMVISAYFGNTLLGGYNFTWKAVEFKWSRFNPIQGIKRILGVQAWIELIKSIGKVILVTCCAAFMLVSFFYPILGLSEVSYKVGIYEALEILLWIGLVLACSLLPILLIDIPFQSWNYTRNLRMTKQQVKDEFKDTEGKPEIKSRIRRTQQEMAIRRMMSEVPKADVVITNPTHFAVALSYDSEKRGAAPVVIAKGSDHIAMKIIEVARNYDISVISSPALARSIYYTTEIDSEIPDGLYLAVAQVLAYVYQLNNFQKGKGRRPKPLTDDLPIPDDLRH